MPIRDTVSGNIKGMTIAEIQAAYNALNAEEEAAKGGEGSGNFGHAGIPGHHGGSRPGTGAKDAGGGLMPITENEHQELMIEGSAASPMGKMQRSLVEDALSVRPPTMKTLDPGVLLKWRVCSRLAREQKLSDDDARDFIAQWAQTSNDEHLDSLRIQQAAAQVLGANFSTWQEDRLKVAQEGDATDRARMEENYRLYEVAWDKRSKGQPLHALSDEEQAAWITPKSWTTFPPKVGHDEYIKIAKKITLLYHVGDDRPMFSDPAKTGEIMTWMYNNTQKALADHGFSLEDTVILYRGFIPTEKDRRYYREKTKRGDTVKYRGNALESWSFSEDEAVRFGLVVVGARVKVKDIVSMPGLGFGCHNEAEVVIRNTAPVSRVTVLHPDTHGEFA